LAEGIRPLPLDLPELQWDSFDPTRFIMDYDKNADIMYVRLPQARPATSIDLDEEVWLRVDPVTGEIVGFEIDDFELVFLRKHPELAAPWHEVRPRQTTEKVALVLRILLEFVRSMAGPHPQQPRLQPHAS
jgi:uncharacterized protein YuzE